MKAKPHNPIRALRRILGETQGKFAATIGVSKDAVASWETGRNPVSASMARRIALVTGVDERALMNHELPLLTMNPNPQRQPYTLEEFKRHRKMFWGQTAEESVRRQLSPCMDTLELLFRAAANYGQGAESTRLPGVLGSFIQWCQQTREDFELEAGIDAQLMQRKRPLELNHSYKQWREMAKEQPHTARQFKFKDDPKRGDQEMLALSIETVPMWMPGTSMRAAKGSRA
jgi:transcriptional regulator with XRE-family HTH domain